MGPEEGFEGPMIPKHEHAWSSWWWDEGRNGYLRKCQHTKCSVHQYVRELAPKEGVLGYMTIISKDEAK